MIVPEAVVLLVCGVIVSERVRKDADHDAADDDDNEAYVHEFVPVTDCLNWLQDLQRALRRDNDTYRPLCLMLRQWGVVKNRLLPLALECRYDKPLVLTIVKILVILTKPVSDEARRARTMTVDVVKTPEG